MPGIHTYMHTQTHMHTHTHTHTHAHSNTHIQTFLISLFLVSSVSVSVCDVMMHASVIRIAKFVKHWLETVQCSVPKQMHTLSHMVVIGSPWKRSHPSLSDRADNARLSAGNRTVNQAQTFH